MNKSDQMVMGFQSPMAELNYGPSWENRCTPSFSSMGDSQLLRAFQFQRLGLARQSLSCRWEMRRFVKMACKVAVDCLAMAGCVLFAALATLLFGM